MKALALGILCFALQAPALAAAPTTESLERLLEVTQAQRTTDALLQQTNTYMRLAFDQVVGTQNLNAEQRRRADEVFSLAAGKMSRIMGEEMSWPRIKDFTVQIYQQEFTQEEVDGLISFFESPAGKAFIEKMPVVMQKSMALMQQRMGSLMERVDAAMRELAVEIRARPPAAK